MLTSPKITLQLAKAKLIFLAKGEGGSAHRLLLPKRNFGGSYHSLLAFLLPCAIRKFGCKKFPLWTSSKMLRNYLTYALGGLDLKFIQAMPKIELQYNLLRFLI